MKAIILAGGFGSRLSEETILRPKPMVEIGGRPILWHIMNIYASYGIKEFIIALGYKAEIVKEYFLNFYALNNDISIDLSSGKTTIHDGNQPDWKIHLVDTGLYTETGGRLKRLASWLDKNETFMFTYGDGVADIDLHALLQFHKAHGKLATRYRGSSTGPLRQNGLSRMILSPNFMRSPKKEKDGSAADFSFSTLKS